MESYNSNLHVNELYDAMMKFSQREFFQFKQSQGKSIEDPQDHRPRQLGFARTGSFIEDLFL